MEHSVWLLVPYDFDVAQLVSSMNKWNEKIDCLNLQHGIAEFKCLYCCGQAFEH